MTESNNCKIGERGAICHDKNEFKIIKDAPWLIFLGHKIIIYPNNVQHVFPPKKLSSELRIDNKEEQIDSLADTQVQSHSSITGNCYYNTHLYK